MKHPYDQWWETHVHRIDLGSVQGGLERPFRVSSCTLENCKAWVQKQVNHPHMLKLCDVDGQASANAGLGKGWIIWPTTAGNIKRHTLKNNVWSISRR